MTGVAGDWVTDPHALPAVPGAYAVRIVLSVPAVLPPRFAPLTLGPGTYLYLGSARGPGGIRARCARHLRRDKARRWHVDWLTTVAANVAAQAFPGGDECALTAALLDGGPAVPVAGFGSSDCRRCPAHLLVAVGEGAVSRRLAAFLSSPP